MNGFRIPDEIAAVTAISVIFGLILGLVRRSKRGFKAMLATFLVAPLIGAGVGWIVVAFNLGLGPALLGAAVGALLGEQLIIFLVELVEKALEHPDEAWRFVRENFRRPWLREPPRGGDGGKGA
jgi:hypothetical protein